MLFYPVKVMLKAFAILFKVHWAYCVEFVKEFIFLAAGRASGGAALGANIGLLLLLLLLLLPSFTQSLPFSLLQQ